MTYKDLQELLVRRFNIPREEVVRKAIRSFTIAEKAVFYCLALIFIFSGVALVLEVNRAFTVEVPTSGGVLTEGVVGNPRFINPVLAISEADKNLVSFIYSGLVRINPNGEVENDLAESLTISDDHKTYVVKLRSDARFHDGMPVSAEDVIFTIQKIVDPIIKSPRRGNWDGVSIEKIDDLTLSFTLKQAYTPFIYNLTTGILPRHIWKNVSPDEFSFSQFNTLPIGSGPYEMAKVERNSGGIPHFYELVPFNSRFTRNALINKLVFRFYPSETALIEAYNEGEIESLSGISAERVKELGNDKSQILTSPLPRVFAVFFNQSQAKVLLRDEVREALDLATPRQEIITDVLGGFGVAIDGPIPAGVYSWTASDEGKGFDERFIEAQELLSEAGWEFNEETGILELNQKSGKIELSFSISTGDAPELQAVANKLVAAWEKLGAKVSILTFETGDLNQNVIRPRNFDALLFGEVVGRDADLYPFWHSSQRTDPGLNIALYANNRADKLLDEARSSSDPKVIEESYLAFTEELKKDKPAIFLYTPSFLYVLPKKVGAVNLGSLTVTQDRFLGVRDWYVETDRVWKIFVN